MGHEAGRKATLLDPGHRSRPGRCRQSIFAACYHPGDPPNICDEHAQRCIRALIDEGVSVNLYPDVDRDGFGAAGSTAVPGCVGRPGFSTLDNDCDDTKPAIVPGSLVCTVNGGIQICTSDGSYKGSSCGQTTCHPQPNGTGLCF